MLSGAEYQLHNGFMSAWSKQARDLPWAPHTKATGATLVHHRVQAGIKEASSRDTLPSPSGFLRSPRFHAPAGHRAIFI